MADFKDLKKNDEVPEPQKVEVAKVKTPIQIKKITREKLIKDCKEPECNGKPILVDFQVHNFCGKRCDRCYIIASYERNGASNNRRT